MSEEDKVSKRRALQAVGQSQQTSQGEGTERRGILKGAATSLLGITASLLGVSDTGSATGQKDFDTQPLEVNPRRAQEAIKGVNQQLLDALVADGHISEPSANIFPAHKMSNKEYAGGVERLLAGEIDQRIFHKQTNQGGRLSLNVPTGEHSPFAVFHPKDGSNRVFYDAKGNKEEISTSDHCNGCWCTWDAACVGDAWVCDEHCPNCWVGDCQTVKYGCGC
ncbi:hypothetical protein [Halorussus lipolyticus]|uniref:hypothetical protein n=1 Tax=Halorussus lipolyticus TaxID=3034024 RepID=UPI0023E7FF85|nr:hypothetical protein [Halorussus sp. DT80]